MSIFIKPGKNIFLEISKKKQSNARVELRHQLLKIRYTSVAGVRKHR
jgi:hypothetical protein